MIQGVRRCGKSTLLRQLIDRFRLEPRRCAFLDFEDPRLAGELSFPLLDRLVEAFRDLRGPGGRLTYFLDEIQWVDGWQRWLRSRLERPDDSAFVVTGSNARLLAGELATVLTGRHLSVELFPLSLAELRQEHPETTIEQYLHAGGFPEPLALGEDADRLVRTYFDDIVERDVRERAGARSARAVRQVAQMVLESAGSELSFRRVAAASGLAIETARDYVHACEAAGLLLACPFFAWSERKRSSRHQKYYPVDTALRRVVTTEGAADRGKALECAVHLALRRRFREVSYWRERAEVDFVVVRERRPVPIQVTWAQPEERHHRALDSFYERFPHAEEAVFVTAETFEEALSALTDRGDRGGM